eukprot:CFRG1967T1
MSEKQYNTKNPSVKRVLKEAKELNKPTDMYAAGPLEENIFEWHFTVRGPSETPFEGGIYHGRILLPPEYPMKPPSIIVLTPNGRFEVGKKICLSISAYHPEYWRPSWSIRTVLLAFISFLPTDGKGSLGALDYTNEERMKLAKKSLAWKCGTCGGHNAKALLELNPDTPHEVPNANDAELISQIAFKPKLDKKDTDRAPSSSSTIETENTIESDGGRRRSTSASTASTTSVLTQRQGLRSGSPTGHIAPRTEAQPQAQPLAPRRQHAIGEIILTILIWGVSLELITLILVKFAL